MGRAWEATRAGLETQVVTAPKPGGAWGGGAPEPDRKLVLGEGHSLLCPPTGKGPHLAPSGLSAGYPGLSTRKQRAQGAQERFLWQTGTPGHGRGARERVQQESGPSTPTMVCFWQGVEAGALGSEGGGPELVLELWPWAHPSPACSLLSALGKTTRLPALLDERRRVKPSDGAQHTRKCRKVGGSPSQRRAEPQTSRGQHAAAGGGCWTGHPPCGESEA